MEVLENSDARFKACARHGRRAPLVAKAVMFPKTYFNLMMQGKRGLSLELTFWLFLFFKQFHLSTAGLRSHKYVVLKHDIDVF